MMGVGPVKRGLITVWYGRLLSRLLIDTGIMDAHWVNLRVEATIYLAGTMIRLRIESKVLRRTLGVIFETYDERVVATVLTPNRIDEINIT
jgi:hypothetical protein